MRGSEKNPSADLGERIAEAFRHRYARLKEEGRSPDEIFANLQEIGRLRQRTKSNFLRSGGALDHYTTLREELGRYEADVEMLRQRLDIAERLANTKTELDMERTRLVKALRDDIHEREGIVREVILSFEELSQSLYERAGSLTISDTPNGPQFDVHNGFDLQNYVNETRLTDATETGGLFGFRFD